MTFMPSACLTLILRLSNHEGFSFFRPGMIHEFTSWAGGLSKTIYPL